MDNVVFQYAGYNKYTARLDGALIGWAKYQPEGNYVCVLGVHPDHRRKGVATALVRFVARHLGVKLNRCPRKFKNAMIQALGDRMGDELGPEYCPDADSN
jgi:ribosomal protein S18 acetylase RimI-like enzyme